MDGGEEVPGRFIVTGGQRTELLQLTEEVFNQMARFVKFLIVLALLLAVGLGRNDCRFPGLLQSRKDTLVGIVALIGNDQRRRESRQQHIGPLQITSLPRRHQKAGWVPERIHGGMNFRAQPALTASNRLVLTRFF
jgi:hypothetical protein